MQESCGFFSWADEPSQIDGPPCLCGFPSRSFVVRKDSSNKGRRFFVCPVDKRCTFFEWADTPSSIDSKSNITGKAQGNYGPVVTPVRNDFHKGGSKSVGRRFQLSHDILINNASPYGHCSY